MTNTMWISHYGNITDIIAIHMWKAKPRSMLKLNHHSYYNHHTMAQAAWGPLNTIAVLH